MWQDKMGSSESLTPDTQVDFNSFNVFQIGIQTEMKIRTLLVA